MENFSGNYGFGVWCLALGFQKQCFMHARPKVSNLMNGKLLRTQRGYLQWNLGLSQASAVLFTKRRAAKLKQIASLRSQNPVSKKYMSVHSFSSYFIPDVSIPKAFGIGRRKVQLLITEYRSPITDHCLLQPSPDISGPLSPRASGLASLFHPSSVFSLPTSFS